ncbi:MAG: tetratricopeptide repeat protein [Candidatus Dadabacteria bacterium]
MKSRKKDTHIAEKTRENADSGSAPVGGSFASGLYPYFTNRLVLCLILFAVSFAIFIPSLDNEFVWDDVTFIVDAESYLETFDFNPAFLIKKPKSSIKYYRPLFTLSFVTDYRMWGLSPFGYHLTNILLHSACTLALYFMVLVLGREFRLKSPDAVAFLSSLLFAVYPLHVESVSFISARADIMAGILLFLSVGFYALSYRKLLYLIPAALCLYLSLYTKEVAYSFPIVLLGFDVISRRLFNRINIVKYAFMALLVSVYIVVRVGSFLSGSDLMKQSIVRGLSGMDAVTEFLVGFLGSYLYYGWRFIYPYELNHFISSIPGGSAFYIALSAVFVLAVVAACIVSMKKKENYTAFSLLLLFATLGPAVMIAIFPTAVTRFAERFMYIPSAGFCMLAAYAIVLIGSRSGIKWLGWALAGALTVSYAVVTVNGQAEWQSNLTFWKAAVDRTPEALTPRVNYGEALRNVGRTEEALEQFRLARQRTSKVEVRGKTISTVPLAMSYINRGNYDMAEKVLEEALRDDPGVAADYNHLMGYIYIQRKDLSAAKNYLEESAKIRWWNANVHYLLGSIYYTEAGESKSPEDYKKAEAELRAAVRINGKLAEARVVLAKTLLATGRRDEAISQAKEALKTARIPTTVAEAKAIIGKE